MTMDQRALDEMELWFRALLRGDTEIQHAGISLFKVMAERQNAGPLDTYLPRTTRISIPPGRRTSRPATSTARLPVTLQPPAEAQRELIRLTSPRNASFDEETKWEKPAPETRRPALDEDDVKQSDTDATPPERDPRR
jgi:hypothetical protein